MPMKIKEDIKTDPSIRSDRSNVLEEKKNVTSRISDSCRVVGFGLLAVFYSVRVGGGEMEKIGTAHPYLVWAVGGFGFLSVLFDYLQYTFAAWAVGNALKTLDYKYDPNSYAYILRHYFYVAKQVAIILGVVALGYLFVMI